MDVQEEVIELLGQHVADILTAFFVEVEHDFENGENCGSKGTRVVVEDVDEQRVRFNGFYLAYLIGRVVSEIEINFLDFEFEGQVLQSLLELQDQILFECFEFFLG